MKLARGSNRSPTTTREIRNQKKSAPGITTNEDRDQSGNAKTSHPKASRRRKAEGGPPSVSKKIKVQDSWKLMPTSTITAVENMLDLAILATLALKRKEKEESQEHLNIIKHRFLAHCAQLKVPVQKQRDLIYSSQRHQEENKKSVEGKTMLNSLEQDLKAVVSVLERTAEQTVSLQQSCSMLRDELEEEEEKGKQILQISDRGILKLPPLPPRKEETTLESRLRKIIPECECETTAQKLGVILQDSEPSQDAQALLLQAQKHADLLFPSLNSAASHLDGVEMHFS